jgi:hypothetical protein
MKVELVCDKGSVTLNDPKATIGEANLGAVLAALVDALHQVEGEPEKVTLGSPTPPFEFGFQPPEDFDG